MNVFKRHKNTFWYLLTTVSNKKIHTKHIKGDHSKGRNKKEKSLKSDLRGRRKRQSFKRKEISKEIMCDGLWDCFRKKNLHVLARTLLAKWKGYKTIQTERVKWKKTIDENQRTNLSTQQMNRKQALWELQRHREDFFF